MSHKYRAAIGRESPRPASRRFTHQLEPRCASRAPSCRKSNFCGKNSGFAACREMPAFLYSRQGISSPANAEGIPEHFFHARKSRWPAGDKSPAGRNPRRPNAGLRFGKRSASETGFFLAGYPARGYCQWFGSQTFPKYAAQPCSAQYCTSAAPHPLLA